MDILNWLYLRKEQLIRKTPNNPETDLVAIGADVTFAKRDDQYKTYAMTIKDLATAGCVANNTLETLVSDQDPYIILPVLRKTCTYIKDQVPNPPVGVLNLQGWEVSGTVFLSQQQSYQIYLGTVTITNSLFTGTDFVGLNWKLTGTVQKIILSGEGEITLSTEGLGGFNTLLDENQNTVYVEVKLLQFPSFSSGAINIDLVLDVQLTSASFQAPLDSESIIEGIVSFQIEFFTDELAVVTHNLPA